MEGMFGADEVEVVIPVWAPGFRAVVAEGVTSLAHPDGFVVAREDERVAVRGRFREGAASEGPQWDWSGGAGRNCMGNFLLVGEDVAVVAEGQAAKGKSFFFPRVLEEAESNVSLVALLEGRLVARERCLLVVRESSGQGPVVVWPAEAGLRVNSGVVEVLDGEGEMLARVGEEVAIGGGVPFGRQFDGASGCEGRGWHASSVVRQE